MDKLFNSIKKITSGKGELPFSVYSSIHEQMLLDVPIAKPLLIAVVKGDKELGRNSEIRCQSGQFIFLSDSPSINIRNIPKNNAYFAMLIEFSYEDFDGIPAAGTEKPEYFSGEVTLALENALQQFVECVAWAPECIFTLRKKEILRLLYHLGYTQVAAMMSKEKVSQRLHDIFLEESFHNVTTDFICKRLSMSESTLRRKLRSECTSVQDVKDKARLGLALHLLQTTSDAIGLIAEKCCYYSQSRFTGRFKARFGLTPTELRKTKMTD